MKNRTDKGQFAKGISGNPGGRPKLPEELRELFRAKGPEALEVLSRCLRSTDERIAIAAATAILDRGMESQRKPSTPTSMKKRALLRRSPYAGRIDRGMVGEHQTGRRSASAGHQSRYRGRAKAFGGVGVFHHQQLSH
jgi:hypothetical protein